MKLSSLWKTLNRDQRRAWSAWAKSNKVLLDSGAVRRVNGHKAMTLVVRNRTLAGEAVNVGVVPAATVWRGQLVDATDAGAYTIPPGELVLRPTMTLPIGTKVFVFGTFPVLASEQDPKRQLRFVTCLSIATQITAANFTPRFETAYRATCGSYDGPGLEGFWDEAHFIWFRVHEYVDGQLGPGAMFPAGIYVDA